MAIRSIVRCQYRFIFAGSVTVSACPLDFRKLVLIESGLPGISPAPEQSPWHVVFQFVRDLPERLVRGNERAYLSWFFRNLTYDPTAIASEDIDEYVRMYAAPGAMRAGFEYYRNWSENRQIYEEYIMMLLYWIQDKLLLNAWNPEAQRTPNTVCTTEQGSVDRSPRIAIFLSVDYTKYESMQRNTQPLLNTFDREENQISMIPAPLLTLSTLLMSFRKRDDQ